MPRLKPIDCPFCWSGQIKSSVEEHVCAVGNELHYMMVFEPLSPVVRGHLLVVPVTHVTHAAEDPQIAAATMKVAARVARRYVSANIITSIGEAATQTVEHLHLHVVPRTRDDGLKLPWSSA